MTTTTDLTARLKLLIRAELVAQCKQMNEQDRPFNVNNPGDDTHFHEVVTDIQQDMMVYMAERVEEVLLG